MGTRSHEQAALLTDYDAGSAYSEAFHTLFANIRFNWESEKNRQLTLLITAPTSSSGQATIAANVAIAAARSGTPTILVDADLRNSTLEQRFGTGQHRGLADLLTQEQITEQDIASCLQPTFIPGLRLLSAGSAAGAASLFHLSKVEEMISCLRSQLALEATAPGVVLFHSPAVQAGADASIIGALVDQTLLIIARNRTTRTQAKQAQEQLQRVHANLVGLVIMDM